MEAAAPIVVETSPDVIPEPGVKED
jgi:hypothetical protein